MSGSNDGSDHPAPQGASDGEPSADAVQGRRAGGTVRMWIGGVLFLVAAVSTFIAGDDNRWISIPAAIVTAAALVDILSVNQRRPRSE